MKKLVGLFVLVFIVFVFNSRAERKTFSSYEELSNACRFFAENAGVLPSDVVMESVGFDEAKDSDKIKEALSSIKGRAEQSGKLVQVDQSNIVTLGESVYILGYLVLRERGYFFYQFTTVHEGNKYYVDSYNLNLNSDLGGLLRNVNPLFFERKEASLK